MNLPANTKHYTMNELGIGVNRQALIEQIANAPAGGIIFVKGYEGKTNHGEVADYFYLKGVNYGRMQERSLVKLSEIANDPTFQLSVKWNEWLNPITGEKTTARAKNKVLKQHTAVYNTQDLVFQVAVIKVRNSLENPQERPQIYEKEGNGIYTQNDGTLHIRDCQLLLKKVIKEGDWPISTSSMEVAVADTIRRLLPVSKYRQVRLDGRFDYISVDKQIVMQTDGGAEVYIGFEEHAGLLTPRLPDLETVMEASKVTQELAEILE